MPENNNLLRGSCPHFRCGPRLLRQRARGARRATGYPPGNVGLTLAFYRAFVSLILLGMIARPFVRV